MVQEQKKKKVGSLKDSKNGERFILKKDGKVFLMPIEVVSSLSADEAMRLSVLAKVEQRLQLMEDAIRGDQYVNHTKVVDGLENSIRKFQEMFPWIRDQIKIFGANNKIGRS